MMVDDKVGPDGMKDCFRVPVPEVFEAAALLSEGVAAHLRGDSASAARALRAADMPGIGEWIDSVWLGPWKPPYRAITKVVGLPPVLPKAMRDPLRAPTPDLKRSLIARDGFHCRFCAIPLVRAEVRKSLVALYPDAVRWTGRGERHQHRGLQALWLQYDHVVVHSRGGLTSLENMVIACAGCNFGRDRFMLEEVGVRDPRVYPRTPDWHGAASWHGLEEIMPAIERMGGGRRSSPVAVAAMPSLAPSRVVASGSSTDLPTRPDSVARIVVDAGLSTSPGFVPNRGWAAGMDELQPGLSDRILEFAKRCESIGLSNNVADGLSFRYRTPDGVTITPLAFHAKYGASIPWAIGPYKEASKTLCLELESVLPGSMAYETERLWSLCERTSGKARKKLHPSVVLDYQDVVLLAYQRFLLGLSGMPSVAPLPASCVASLHEASMLRRVRVALVGLLGRLWCR